MKKILKTILVILFINCHFVIAQTTTDEFENGIKVNTGEKIFLRFGSGKLSYASAKTLLDIANTPDFHTLEDSLIFLVSKSGVNIYLNPLNPLNYSYTTEVKEIADPIDQVVSKAFGSIDEVLGSITKKGSTPGPNNPKVKANVKVNDSCQVLKNAIEFNLKTIEDLLKKDQKVEITDQFKLLKKLSFLDEATTISELDKIEKKIDPITKYFTNTDNLIEATKKLIDGYKCDLTNGYVANYIYNIIIKDFKTIIAEQKKRLENLQKAFKLVKDAQEAATNEGNLLGLKWCIKLDEVPSRDGNISLYTVTIKESGYKLSDKDEIENIETKEVLKRTLRLRRFHKYIGEVSVGTAYTFYKYYTYGTTSDSTGQQYVSDPIENTIKNINISTMINWNLYSPGNNVHPLIQTGVGINSGIPTLLLGVGCRFSDYSKTRLRVAFGIAFTWIKDLDTLEVGDTISGTADIEKDLEYKFSFWGEKYNPQPYISLGYNF